MKYSDSEIRQLLFSKLPDEHNLEMWANETLVEFKRLNLLSEKGVKSLPLEGSLLWLLLEAMKDPRLETPSDVDSDSYQKMFGTPPDYCWTVPAMDLFTKDAAAASQPANAWMRTYVPGDK